MVNLHRYYQLVLLVTFCTILSVKLSAQTSLKALVGGTLIDGFGGRPIHNGTISEGKHADIIAVKGDVLRYISWLQDVDMVIKHGQRIK